MTLALAARLARRELRGGLAGFRVFLLCLALGVAAIAAVGTLREAIRAGLDEQGAVLLGGDAQMAFTYRMASDEERAFMAAAAARVSEIVDFRSMVVVGQDQALTQVKAVDAAYPLYGEVLLDPPQPLAQALAERGGLPGAVLDGVLADRLGLRPGDRFRLGLAEFRLTARLLHEPDSATGGFGLGPRSIVRRDALEGSGLLEPGTLYNSLYRLALPTGTDLAALKANAEARFRDTGLGWQDSRNGAPGVERFVERLGAFLVLVGLAGLAVGGVGVATAVRSYLDGKVPVIATLKAMGAEQGLILHLYLIQIGALAALGIVAGLVIGAGVPLLFGPLIAAQLPFPAVIRLAPLPLLEAALYGALVALIFTLWPLARTAEIRAAQLFRETAGRAAIWPRPGMVLLVGVLAAVLVGLAALLSGTPRLALGTAAGVCAALAVLWVASLGLRRLARRISGSAALRGRPAWRLAFGAIAAAGQDTGAVVMSLGLGLSVLAAMGQIDTNLRAAIDRDLPKVAPAYFIVDIQNDQIEEFLGIVNADPAITKVESAPMLRGIITRINGAPAREVAGDHWVLRGDRGVTYSDVPPANTTVTAGTWWQSGHNGPPEVSFAAEEAAELGLKLGDTLTVNILGRDITATITSFREVDFSTAGIGFVMSMTPSALAGAPHTHIATLYSAEADEGALLRNLAGRFPNITAIRVRDAIARVTEALGAIASATAWAAGAALLTGFVVLIGAAAAGERARAYEAAVLKTLGATRAGILASFALRSALLGAAAGLVAILAGAVAGWAVLEWVMEADYHFAPGPAVMIVSGGVLATLAAGLVFALRPLAARPAQVLRGRE